jgi:hypothetical protein
VVGCGSMSSRSSTSAPTRTASPDVQARIDHGTDAATPATPSVPRPGGAVASASPRVTLVSPEQIAAADRALHDDPALAAVIGSDFTVLRVIPAHATEGSAWGVGFELKLAEPRVVPAGLPVIGGGDERTPGTLGRSDASVGPVRFLGVVLRPDHTLWWYYPVPDELGEHDEDVAATTVSH